MIVRDRRMSSIRVNEVIHCPTKREAEAICKLLHKHNLTWRFGESYIDNTQWNKYGENTCYNPTAGYFESKRYYKKEKFTIRPASEFLPESFYEIEPISEEEILEKVKYAYDVMSGILGTKTDGRRNKEQKDIMYMLMFYTYRMIDNSEIPLAKIGLVVSGVEDRKRPYHHSSVLHAIKKHLERMKIGKRGGYGEYVEYFESFCNRMLSNNITLATRIYPNQNRLNRHIYGYLPSY